MKRYFFFLPVLTLICTNVKAQTGQFIPEMAFLDTAFTVFLKTWDVPGGTLSIVKDGRLVYSRGVGYADLENEELVTPRHMFRIASISKSVTGILFMKMIEDGMLSIDDLVFGEHGILSDSAYANIKDPRVRSITVRHLLQHTSGWGFVVNDSRDPMFMNAAIAEFMGVDKPASPEVTIQYMLGYEDLKSEPGTQYFYSNFGYSILGRVVESLTGLTYEDYAKEVLEEHAGITDMRIGSNLLEGRFENEVKYYDFKGAGMPYSVYGDGNRVPWPYGGFHLEGMDSHGGWIASSEELAQLMVRVDGFDTKPDFLSPQSIELMSTPSSVNNYAMGFSVNSADNWWHNGSLPGSTSLWVRTSSGMSWVVLLNTRPHHSEDINGPLDSFIWEQVQQVYNWPEHDLFEAEKVNNESHEYDGSPEAFRLHQNYPNPFNPSTTIRYDLDRSSKVLLSVYDLMGRELEVLVDQRQSDGTHAVRFNADDYPSGIYFYRLQAQGHILTGRMTLLK